MAMVASNAVAELALTEEAFGARKAEVVVVPKMAVAVVSTAKNFILLELAVDCCLLRRRHCGGKYIMIGLRWSCRVKIIVPNVEVEN